MKNNFITKIIGATLAFAMMIGGAVGINAAKQAKEVDAAAVAGTFEKVTSSTLTAGDVVIFVNSAATYALGDLSATSSGYGTIVSVTPDANGKITLAANTTVTQFVVEVGASSGYAFKSQNNSNFNGQYMAYTSSSTSKNNYLTRYNSNSSSNTQGQFTLNYGTTMAVRNVYNTGRWLRFNSDRFACYYNASSESSTGTGVNIYKKLANVAVTGVSVSPTSATLGVGATQQLTPAISPADATNKNVSYSSGNTNVATVTASGLITAVAAGNTTITVTTEDGEFTATCGVTVTAPVNVTGVSLNKNSTTIAAGNTETLVASVVPNDASNKNVNWTSSNENVATVSAGVVTAVAGGVATITATTVDGGFTASCEVTVTVPSSVTFAAGTDQGTNGSANHADSISKNGITFSGTNLATTTAEYRIYANSSVTVSSAIGKMRAIEFTGCDSGYKVSNISSANVGTLSVSSSSNTASWSGNANSVTFTIGSQARASQIVITMAPTVPTIILDKDSLELKTNVLDGEQVTAMAYGVDNPNFIWTPANGNNVTVQVVSTNENAQTVRIKPNTNAEINTTVTVSLENTTASETIQVHVSEPGPGETAETAYSVAQAKAAIASANADIANVYIVGIVSQVDDVNLSTHKATYWISDDGTTADHFKIYRGKNVNNTNFTSINQIMPGDEVVVYGTISNQHESLNEDNYLISITLAPRVNSITLTPNAVSVNPSSSGNIIDLFTNIAINQEDGSNKTANDIVWTSDDDDIFAVIDDNQYLAGDTHRTSTTIHASLNGIEFATATVNVFISTVHVMEYNLPEEWREVTNPSTLTVGDQVILTGVKNGATYAAGTYSSGNNIPADTENTLTISNGVADGVQDSMIYTLVAGSVEGSVAFKDSTGKYLYAAGGSDNNHMKTQDSVNADASFILNSNGTVICQGSSTHNSMRYNQANNLFSCYASGQTAIKFYKLSTGTAELDLFNLSAIRTAHEDENSAYIRLGVSLSEEDWAAMNSAFGIAGYGVMLIRETTLEATAFDTIAELYNSNDTENKAKLSNRGKNSETAPQDFSVAAKISISNDSDRAVVFCAATYVKASDGTIYFINETRGSLVGLL